MNRYRQLPTELLSIAIPTIMAGCAVHVIFAAMGFVVSPLMIYAAALLSAGFVMLSGRGTGWMIAAIAVPFIGVVASIVMGSAQLSAFIAAIRSPEGLNPEMAALNPEVGLAAAIPLTMVIGAMTALMYKMRTGRPFALLIPIASILLSLALGQDLSIWIALPGIVGCIAAFTGSENTARHRMDIAAMAACLCIAVMSIVLAPGAGTSWEPLRQLAEKIRSITDEYIHFTSERVAFSINEKGYDHGGMVSDTVVTMLGGSANPTDDEVMRVDTEADILLRGTIKQTYTGYSWVDERVKARYLYYDFTRSGSRSEIFGADAVKKNNAFRTININVRMSERATSTLFVPAHMSEFKMDLADAVYYNSVGEVFLTRDVQRGDTYELAAQIPISDEELIRASMEAEHRKDSAYAAAQADYTGLPDGIDERVYALSMSITEGMSSNIEKAMAIREFLAQNYSYTLDSGYPDPGRDFVSWFLLEEKKGYCSYFASAMTVLCRIAGVPARYVEGYYVRAGNETTIVTGHNAHAWVEVYLSGIGWTAFDPTAAAYGAQYGFPETEEANAPNAAAGLGGADNEGTPFENSDGSANDPGESGEAERPDTGSGDSGSDPNENDGDPDNGEGDSDDGDSNEDPDNDAGDGDDSGNEPDEPDQPENEPEQQPDDQPETDRKNHTWIVIAIVILILAALIAACVAWIRKRLVNTDPIRMCKRSKDPRKAAMILYRAILTMLTQLGFAPMNGELPEDFAIRVCQSVPNDAYIRFVTAAVRSNYSGGGLKRSELEDGRDAYLAFLASMKPMEKIRYNSRRVIYGIGDTESIP